MRADFRNLYLFGPAYRRGAVHVDPSNDIKDAFAVLRGEAELPAALRFVRTQGSQWVDVVGTTLAPLVLISRRLTEALLSHSFTGWNSVPISIDAGGLSVKHPYDLLIVTGRSGPIDHSRSKRTILPAPPGGRASTGWRGLYFAAETWDGTDVFVPANTGYVCVTGRVKTCLESLRISNCRFDQLDSFERLML